MSKFFTLVLVCLGVVLPCQAQTRPLTEGLHSALLPMYRQLESGGVGSFGIVGDSVSLLGASYNWQLRNHLWDDWGSSGDGYIALARFNGSCNNTGGEPRCGIELIRGPGSFVSEDTGFWDSRGVVTPDGMWLMLEPTPFPASSTVHVFGREIIIHYTRRFDAGTLIVKLEGSTIATLDTNAPSGVPQAARLVIDTGIDDPDTLHTIRLETSGEGTVQINAIEMRSSNPGLRYHRLARGGAGPFMFQASMTNTNAAVMQSLEMDLMFVMLDAAAGDGNDPDAATYEANLATLVDWYIANLPGTRLVLVTHHPFRPEIGPQADAILRIARERGLGYINLFDLFSGFDEMNDLGYMNGIVHFTLLGGQWFGAYIHSVMAQAGTEALIADANADGVFDFFDVQTFLEAFAAGSADLNNDGVSDFFDVQVFLDAFAASVGD